MGCFYSHAYLPYNAGVSLVPRELRRHILLKHSQCHLTLEELLAELKRGVKIDTQALPAYIYLVNHLGLPHSGVRWFPVITSQEWSGATE